jgi:hypothetical protein
MREVYERISMPGEVKAGGVSAVSLAGITSIKLWNGLSWQCRLRCSPQNGPDWLLLVEMHCDGSSLLQGRGEAISRPFPPFDCG